MSVRTRGTAKGAAAFVTPWMVAWGACGGVAAQKGVSTDLFTSLERSYTELQTIRPPISASPGANSLVFTLDHGVFSQQRIFVADGSGRGARYLVDGRSAVISPNVAAIAYLGAASGEQQIWVRDLATGRDRMLTSIHGGIALPAAGWETSDFYELDRVSWSADGRRIAYTFSEPRSDSTPRPPWAVESRLGQVNIFQANAQPLVPTVAALTRGIGARGAYGGSRQTSRVALVDTSNGANTIIQESNLLAPLWSPRDPHVLFALKRTFRERDNFDFVRTNIVEVHVDNGVVRPLTSGSGTDHSLAASPDAKVLAFIHGDSEGDMPSGTPETVVLQNLSSGKSKKLSLEGVPLQLLWRSSRELLVLMRSGLEWHIVTIRDGAAASSITRHARIFSMAMTRKGLVWAEETPAVPAQIVTERKTASPSIIVSDPFEMSVPPRAFRPLQWTNDADQPSTATLAYPRNARAPLPVIVEMYPGSAAWNFPRNSMEPNLLWLAQGYAVLQINVRAPHTWHDRIFSEAGFAGRGAAGVSQLVEDVDRGLAEASATGVVDRTRACGVGHSNGGGALTQYITHAARLRCAVIAAPASASWWIDAYLAPVFTAAASGAGYPWQNPTEYIGLDPLAHLGNVSTPTLFAVGRDDWTFPMTTVALFNGMRYAGSDATLLIYPTEGHSFQGEALRDFWQRASSFVAAHLDP